jgi:hypothetical protein
VIVLHHDNPSSSDPARFVLPRDVERVENCEILQLGRNERAVKVNHKTNHGSSSDLIDRRYRLAPQLLSIQSTPQVKGPCVGQTDDRIYKSHRAFCPGRRG